VGFQNAKRTRLNGVPVVEVIGYRSELWLTSPESTAGDGQGVGFQNAQRMQLKAVGVADVIGKGSEMSLTSPNRLRAAASAWHLSGDDIMERVGRVRRSSPPRAWFAEPNADRGYAAMREYSLSTPPRRVRQMIGPSPGRSG
jgi:hypothetical protein